MQYTYLYDESFQCRGCPIQKRCNSEVQNYTAQERSADYDLDVAFLPDREQRLLTSLDPDLHLSSSTFVLPFTYHLHTAFFWSEHRELLTSVPQISSQQDPSTPLLKSTLPSRWTQRHATASMAVTGLNSSECRHYALFASTFWYHFDASMVVFITSFFAIPGLITLLTIICNIPNDESPARSPATNDSFNTNPHTLDKSRLPESRLMVVARLVGSTIVLGIAACLVTFQILIALFTRHCLLEMASTIEIVFVCLFAAMNVVFVAIGLSTWLASTSIIAKRFSSWCWNYRRRTMSSVKESAFDGIGDTDPSDEMQRRDQQGIGQEHVRSPTPTLPAYMV